MAVRGAGIGGGYLGGFLESYRLAQELARREQEAQERSGLRGFQVQDLLRERQEEEMDRATLAHIIGQQQGRVPAPAIPVTPSTAAATPDQAAFLEANAPGVFPVAQPGGRTADLIPAEATRPPVLSTLMQGVEPAQAARALTRERFRQGLMPLKEAEIERRKTEDRQQAEEFIKAGKVEMQAGNFLGWADTMAAALRRVDRPHEASKYTDYILALRQDEKKQQEANAYLKAVVPQILRYEETGDPEDKKLMAEALSGGTPEARATFGQSAMGNWPRSLLEDKSLPRPVQLIEDEWGKQLQAQMAAGQPYDGKKAYEAAFKKYPMAAGRYISWMRLKHGALDEDLREYLRQPDLKLDKEQVKDAEGLALQQLRREGLTYNTPQGLKRYFELYAEMADKLHKIKETPGQKAARELTEKRTEILKGAGKPLKDMSLQELSLELQRAQTARNVAGSDAEAEETQHHIDDIVAERAQRRGPGAPAKAGSPQAILGGRRFDALGDEEKQGVMLGMAKGLFAAKVKTFEDMKKLSRPERERLRAEITRLEGAGGGQPGRD